MERERVWVDRALANPRAADLLVELVSEMANVTPDADAGGSTGSAPPGNDDDGGGD